MRVRVHACVCVCVCVCVCARARVCQRALPVPALYLARKTCQGTHVLTAGSCCGSILLVSDLPAWPTGWASCALMMATQASVRDEWHQRFSQSACWFQTLELQHQLHCLNFTAVHCNPPAHSTQAVEYRCRSCTRQCVKSLGSSGYSLPRLLPAGAPSAHLREHFPQPASFGATPRHRPQ